LIDALLRRLREAQQVTDDEHAYRSGSRAVLDLIEAARRAMRELDPQTCAEIEEWAERATIMTLREAASSLELLVDPQQRRDLPSFEPDPTVVTWASVIAIACIALLGGWSMRDADPHRFISPTSAKPELAPVRVPLEPLSLPPPRPGLSREERAELRHECWLRHDYGCVLRIDAEGR
jgi:hypothetical protein